MHSARFAEISSLYPPARIPPPEHTCIHLKNDPAAFVFHPVFAPRTGLCYIWIVHGVKVYAVYIIGDEIYYLIT